MSTHSWVERVIRRFKLPGAAEIPSAQLAVITDFLERTRPGSAELNQLNDKLQADELKPEDVALFCSWFARGVAYVGDRFGTVPRTISLSDEDAPTPRYNVDHQSIIVPYRFIANCIQLQSVRQSKTEPLILPWYEMAAMYGVEEAYHHYDIKAHPARSVGLFNAPDGSAAYDETPLELSAKKIVREALRDFQFLNRPIATQNVNAEDLLWWTIARCGMISGTNARWRSGRPSSPMLFK